MHVAVSLGIRILLDLPGDERKIERTCSLLFGSRMR